MGAVSAFRPHILVIGVLSTCPEREDEVEEKLLQYFGPVDRRSERWDFTFTSYYTREMGEGIKRWFLTFSTLVDPETLPDIKILTNRLELEFAENNNRRINIDPGILSPGRLVLATTKDREHRIPLRDGIYGEVTLIYMQGGYAPLPWTYADFREEAYRKFFSEVRKARLKELK